MTKRYYNLLHNCKIFTFLAHDKEKKSIFAMYNINLALWFKTTQENGGCSP